MEHIVYQGSSIYDAALKGNFPLVVLLWGMIAAQQLSPFTPDENNNSVVHFAAAGGNVEILHFFAQQAVLASPNAMTIMDGPNKSGETPLIRAAHVGNVLSVKVLVDLGCNLMHEDANGNTAAHHAAHEGQLWTLHYLLEAQATLNVEGSVPGGQCFMKRDVLQWACEGGKEQVIDYILNRGHDPNIPDMEGRTALHHAILDADKALIKKLVSYGAETDASDDRGLTALSTANNLRRHTIVNMLLDTSAQAVHPVPKSFGHLRRTRLHVMALYAVLWIGWLSLSYVAPWYLFFPGLLVAMFLSMRSMTKSNHKHSKACSHAAAATFPSHVALTLVRQTRGSVFEIQEHQVELRRLQHDKPLNPLVKAWQWIKGQPEVAIGLWLGWLVAFSICLGYRVYVDTGVDTAAAFWNDHVVGLGVLVGTELVCVVVWMVLITGEPGQVATADKDFPALLHQAANGYAPLDQSHCVTCLVAKPIRSKHCASCGVCVARMDHHCVWINNCVGFHNHRLFVAFLVVHLAVLGLYLGLFLLYLSSKHTYLEVLLRDELPEVTVVFWAIVSCLFLSKLLADQVRGIGRNVTVNESINWKRYPYLTHDNNTTMANPFDHGWAANVAEFWKQSVNYMQLMSAPPSTAPQQAKTM